MSDLTDEKWQQLFILLHRPIPWDPIPWWIKLDKEKIIRFNEVQSQMNAKIAALETEKMNELFKIAGMTK